MPKTDPGIPDEFLPGAEDDNWFMSFHDFLTDGTPVNDDKLGWIFTFTLAKVLRMKEGAIKPRHDVYEKFDDMQDLTNTLAEAELSDILKGIFLVLGPEIHELFAEKSQRYDWEAEQLATLFQKELKKKIKASKE